jgi:DNA-binding LacI/PurR family transcriptional regulator
VAGWDDLPVAASLDLTTVAQSLREQGAACAHAALGRDVASVAGGWTVVRRGSTRSP